MPGQLDLDLMPAPAGRRVSKDQFVVTIERLLHSLPGEVGEIESFMVETARLVGECLEAFGKDALSVAPSVAHIQDEHGSLGFPDRFDDRRRVDAPGVAGRGSGPT